ncbi:MAG: hypothetical protein Q4D41_03065 [Prevotellaceae bacterium]|nr:hypothetical protein [Prevotellaceae bacterium]
MKDIYENFYQEHVPDPVCCLYGKTRHASHAALTVLHNRCRIDYYLCMNISRRLNGVWAGYVMNVSCKIKYNDVGAV